MRAGVATASCLAWLAFTGSAFAAPTWSPPIDIAPGDNQVESLPSAAVFGGSDQLTVAWTSTSASTPTLPTARRSLGGSFAAGPALATGDGASEPALARGPGGELYAAWVIGDADGVSRVVMAARVQADGSVTSPQRLSGAGEDAAEPAIAVGPDGRVAVAWTANANDRGQVRAVHGTLGGAALPASTVSVDDSDAEDPDVAFDSGGALQVAWKRLDAGESGRIKAAVELSAGTFAPARVISPADANASEPALAPVTGAGLGVAWTETDASGENTTVRLVIEAPGGIATTTVGGGGDASEASLATDPAGVLHIAWIRTLSETQANVLVSARNAAGGLDAPQVPSADDQASDVDLAFSPAGDAAVTWRRNLGTPEDPAGDMRAAVFDAPRTPSPPSNPPPSSPPPTSPPPGPTPPSAPPPAVPPALGLAGFGVTPGCIRYGQPNRTPGRRLSFAFSLSEPATVVLTIQRRLNSTSLRHCPVRRARGDKGRFGPATVVRLPSPAGPGHVSVGPEGHASSARARSPSRALRVVLRKKLKKGGRRVVLSQSPTAQVPGTYVATLTATSADGRRAGGGLVKFWVLRPTSP